MQGLGGGLLVALAYTMIRELFPEHQRARVFALLSMVWGAAAVIGPGIGGFFAEIDFWRGVYLLNIPVALVLMTLARKTLEPDSPAQSGTRLPWRRLVLLGAGVLSVTFSGQTEIAGLRFVLIAAAVFGVAAMLWLDHRAGGGRHGGQPGPASRLFPSWPASLRHPVGTAYWMFFLFSFSYTPLNVFLPLIAQVLHDVPPSLAGYVATAMSMGWTVAALLASGAGERWQRLLMVSGPLYLLAGVFGQSYFVVEGPVMALVGFIFLTGLGVGQCHAHIANRAMINARPGEETLTAGAIPTMQSLGIAFGAASGGLIANVAGLSDGITTATLSAVTEWVYGFALVPASCLVLVAFRLVWLLNRGTVQGKGKSP